MSKETLERTPAAELWRNTLSRIPALFGRLTYLASLRDPNSGRYSHYGLAARFGERTAAQALLQSHEQVFAEWLCLSLQEQQADLTAYLDSLAEPRASVLEAWQRLKPYLNAIPAGAGEAERLLFRSDLEVLLRLLSNAPGGVCPDQKSAPRP